MTTSTPTLWLRPGEQIVRMLDGDGLCASHRVPVARAEFTWGRHSHPMYGGGLETFQCWRHADGSVCEYTTHVPDPQFADAFRADRPYHEVVAELPLCPTCAGPFTNGLACKVEQASNCHRLDQCRKCGAYESLERRDTGYGWDVTCTECGDNNYYDTGD